MSMSGRSSSNFFSREKSLCPPKYWTVRSQYTSAARSSNPGTTRRTWRHDQRYYASSVAR